MSMKRPGAPSQNEGTRPPASAKRDMTSITVRIPGKDEHDILVGVGILDELPRRIGQLDLARDVLIISSPRIFGLYGDQLVRTLKDLGCNEVTKVLFPDGEEHKNLQTVETIYDRLIDVEALFKSKVLIVNLGGGVVGDVGGYVAATFDRNRDYIQLPTTLLGDVDCGIGGKCGVNFRGKNLVGAFHQPRLVLAELSFLKTLPPREVRSGLAEVIKYGVSLAPDLFDYVESNSAEILGLNLEAIRFIVERSFQLKTQIVEQDERDTKGIRAKLNFGHTIGHALEAATQYTKYAHGEAIAIGMLCACEIAEGLGLCDGSVRERLESLCQRVGLPTAMEANVETVLARMQHDKKFIRGVNRFVLPTRLGDVVLRNDIAPELIRDVVRGRAV